MDLVKALLVFTSIGISISRLKATSEKRLITMLLENYRQNGIEGRPIVNTTRSISISVGFSLLQILEFNQDRQSIAFVGWISLRWQDSLLRWNARDFDNIRQVALHPDHIWTPDVVLLNALSPPKTIYGTKLVVTEKGEVLWISQSQYDMACSTAPYRDESECEARLGSWTLNSDMLQLSAASEHFDLSHYTANGQWDIVRTLVATAQLEYPHCAGVKYATVSYVFALSRRPSEMRYSQEVPVQRTPEGTGGEGVSVGSNASTLKTIVLTVTLVLLVH